MSGGDGVSSLNDLNEKYKQWVKNQKIEGGTTGTCNADSLYTPTSISEATVITDGIDASVAQGPEVSTKGTGQIFLTAAHNGSATVTLSASSTSGGSTTVNAYRIHMKRDSSTSHTVIDSFASGTFTGCNYVLVAKKVGANDSQIAEINAVTNGSDTFINADPILATTGTSSLLKIEGGNTGSTAELRISATDGVTSYTVNAYRINLLSL